MLFLPVRSDSCISLLSKVDTMAVLIQEHDVADDRCRTTLQCAIQPAAADEAQNPLCAKTDVSGVAANLLSLHSRACCAQEPSDLL